MPSFDVLISAVLALLGPPGLNAPTAGYQWPLDPQPPVVRRYEAAPQPWAAGHRGVDLLGRADQSVLAAGGGVIGFRGMLAGRGVVTVIHPTGWRTTYEPVVNTPPVGTPVHAGQPIGTLSPTQSHCAPRVCLHWGLLVAPDGYRDPLSLLAPRVPILLPLYR